VRLLESRHAGLALAGRLTLQRLTEDDSRTVSAAATAVLGTQAQPAPPQLVPPAPAPPPPAPPPPVPPKLQLSATMVDFGRLAQHSQSPERSVRLGNAGGGTLNARSATHASWLKLRQVGDELMIGVETTTAGKHEGVVNVDSDGGSAAIHVLARVDPTPPPAPEPAATTHPEAVPAAPEHAPPSPHEEAARPEAVPAPVPAAPPAAAPEPTTPPAAVDRGGMPQVGDDRRLRVAGGLAVVGALLLVVGLDPPYLDDSRWGSEPALVWYALVVAAFALGAGTCTLLPRTRRLIGPGILLGTVAAPTAVLLGVIIDSLSINGGSVGAGFWLELVAHMILAVAACLAGLALARAGDVRVVPRPPQGVLPRLVTFLGVASAAALLSQFLEPDFDFARNSVPLSWATAMAFVVPASAAVPRRFGVALLGGWIGGSASLFGFNTGVGAVLIICTWLALLLVIIPFARAAPTPRVERTPPRD
jgi:hypothetical protein